MRELSLRTLNVCGCCITLGLSLVMLAYLFFSISARCEQITREEGGQCGVGIGWVLVAIAFVVIAVWSGYQVYCLRKAAPGG